jgi:hypothetical protein
VSTVFLAVVAVFAALTFGLIGLNIGMPTVTVLQKFAVLVHPGLAPLLMPKLEPNKVMVAAVLKGADGAGATAAMVPPIDEIVGAEY